MPSPKSGNAMNPVNPADPTVAEDADVADPGEVARAKAEQMEKKQGKYGATPVRPHRASQDAEEERTSWIEIELVDEEDQPVPGERYEITLPDGSVAKGTLDQNGFARVDRTVPGTCPITFPNLDKDAWGPA
jgi:type VI secretion system secreted protein VgrG